MNDKMILRTISPYLLAALLASTALGQAGATVPPGSSPARAVTGNTGGQAASGTQTASGAQTASGTPTTSGTQTASGGQAAGGARTGEVTGNDVYVRSGPSLNHYTIMKLSAGDRVTIVGQETKWYEILPPADAFSLISDQYIETTDGIHGVVNGDNVRIRAGSSLEGVTNKYTVQTKLSKGAEVTIVGRTADGFYRIRPPAGATLWISRRYVEVLPDRLTRLEDSLKGGPEPGDQQRSSLQSTISASPAEPAGVEGESDEGEPDPLGALPTTQQRKQLAAIDEAMRTELDKPLLERRLDPLVAQYQAVADQEEDDFARRYAAIRIDQLKNMIDLMEAVAKVRRLNEAAESQRKASLRLRTEAKSPLQPIPTGFDAEGELRLSAVFARAGTAPRYRLVESRASGTRTIGYVVVPAGSDIKADGLVGRLVGVRALQKRLQPGLVDPIPVYVAAEIVPIEESSPNRKDD